MRPVLSSVFFIDKGFPSDTIDYMTSRDFTIEGRAFRAGKRVMVIAEIGTGHGGSLEKAKRLVMAAREAGADCAKFQLVYADEILHPDTGFVNLPGGPVRLYDRFRELECPPSFYAEMAAFCREQGLIFLCTPFGLRSARELRAIGPSCLKIASPELNHVPLLREVAGYGLPLILSSGVSRLSDIERAIAEVSAAETAPKATRADTAVPTRALLHCVTSYPAPETDYNLRVLETLASAFGLPVGVSDHSLDPVLVPVLATACGASIVEKHICLSRADVGLDDPVALPPELFARMTKAIREAEGRNPADVIANLSLEYGADRVEAILGSGKKELAPSEAANYLRTNRSIHYLRDMEAGEAVSEGDIAVLRTEKVLTPGLGPEFLEEITGAILVRAVKNGAGATWCDFIKKKHELMIG